MHRKGYTNFDPRKRNNHFWALASFGETASFRRTGQPLMGGCKFIKHSETFLFAFSVFPNAFQSALSPG
jgi:hypothetical protein